MKLNSLTLTIVAALAALPVISFAGSKPSPAPASAATAFDTLKDLRTDAFDARDAAFELQTLLRSDSDLQIHAHKLAVLKDGINTMGREIYQLQRMRASASPLEREAIDHAAPVLKLMADNTQAALLYLRDNPRGLWLANYQRYVNNLANESDTLCTSVAQYVHLAELRGKEQRLEKNLDSEAAGM